MKKFNVTTVKVYQQNGQEKKTYPQVGKLVHFEASNGKEESFILELNMFPETRFCVFPDTPRDQNGGQGRTTSYAPRQHQASSNLPPEETGLETIEYPEEEMGEVPF